MLNRLVFKTLILLVALGMLFPVGVVAQTSAGLGLPGLELRTNEELLILDPDQEIVLTLVVVNARGENSISLKINTTGGLQVTKIDPLNSYISLNQNLEFTSASIDLAKTDAFTSEDLVAEVTVKMVGDAGGQVIVSGDSYIQEQRLGDEFAVDIKFSGASRITENAGSSGFLNSILSVFDGIGKGLSRILGVSTEFGWILLLILTSVVSAVVYLIVIKPRANKVKQQQNPNLAKPSDGELIIAGPNLQPIQPDSNQGSGVSK